MKAFPKAMSAINPSRLKLITFTLKTFLTNSRIAEYHVVLGHMPKKISMKYGFKLYSKPLKS